MRPLRRRRGVLVFICHERDPELLRYFVSLLNRAVRFLVANGAHQTDFVGDVFKRSEATFDVFFYVAGDEAEANKRRTHPCGTSSILTSFNDLSGRGARSASNAPALSLNRIEQPSCP